MNESLLLLILLEQFLFNTPHGDQNSSLLPLKPYVSLVKILVALHVNSIRGAVASQK